jgi:hypothetical protein
MANDDTTGDALAKQVFILTMIGCVLFIGAVVFFVL